MLVYGDRSFTQDTGEKLERIEAGARAAAASAPGLARHAALAGVFIEAGELAQGLADADFHAAGCDAGSPIQDAAVALCMGLARSVRRSWRTGFQTPLRPPVTELLRLRALSPIESITTKTAEGYAFYALYPEAYLEAAEAAAARIGPDVQVIGLRSIGASLAPIVAAGLGARTAVSLRPVGHPFRRELRLSPALEAELTAIRGAHAIVDEGPGLSGSSFAAVADKLERNGVPPHRIHIFLSHAGAPGPEAPPGLRDRWRTWARHPAEADALLIEAGRLQAWVADLVGPASAPLEDLSAGRWRARVFADEADWPPVFAGQERRKFLMRTASGAWLLKFAGLGREGEHKLARAQALHDAGFGPETAGLRHGFLVQRWLDDARPFSFGGRDREAELAHLGRYLAFRAEHFPAGSGRGADLETLWGMARTNIAEALGEAAAAPLDGWKPRLSAIARRLAPVEVDGRLHPWEWLRTADGRIIKADALDHCRAHDLVGCQDIAWDIAGAVAEFDLSPPEQRFLAERVGQVRRVEPEVLALMSVCYRAFQLGRSAMARAAADRADAVRLKRAEARYAHGLHTALAA